MLMKRIVTLLFSVVCFVMQMTGATVQPSTTLPGGEGRPEHLYTMVNGNGVYADAHTYPATAAADAGLFAFYAVDGVSNAYYIYSYSAKKWLTYTRAGSYSNSKNFLVLSDTKVDNAYFDVTGITGGYYELRPYNTTGVAGKYLNWFQGAGANAGQTLGLWEQNGATDTGSKYMLDEVVITTNAYTFDLPEGVKVTIGGKQYATGDMYTVEGSLTRSDITVPAAPAGKFTVVSVNDAAQTVKVSYVDTPAQPAVAAYESAVVFPAQQTAVGEAQLAEADGVYTLSNKVLAASFVKVGDALYFAGSNAMNLLPGTEPFTVAFGSGVTVPASGMTLKSVETADLTGDAEAVGGAEHFNGKMIKAVYAYTYDEKSLELVWKAVLRDGSHYLRTEMEITGVDDVNMFNVIPMIYEVDTKAAGSAPAVVGNTRGAVLMSDKIFAGLETPTGFNTVGEAGGEEAWETVGEPTVKNVAVADWAQVEEGKVPGRFTEVTGKNYPNVRAYTVQDVTLTKGQKLDVLVKYTAGSHKINLGGAQLIDNNGDAAADDFHSGSTGNAHENNTFTMTAPYDGTFSVRVYAEDASEELNATSTVTLTVSQMKEGAEVKTDVVLMQGRWSRNTVLEKGETWKVSSVVGLVAQDGEQANTDIHKTQKRRSFLAYSERERAVPWRAFPAYISWYELNIDRNNAADPTKNMNAEQVLDIQIQWKEKFFDRYGVAPHSFVIDDGWDNYGTWTFHAGFPNEMKDIAARAEEMGAGVGAWLGPVGGYGTSGNYRRQYWTSKGQSMLLSNPEYYAVFKAAAQNLTKNQGDFNFFKFDGISDLFTATGPKASATGDEDAEGIIRLERYVREELKRDIFFNTTVGTWASPFWYRYTDATWRQEGDYGEAGNNTIDREKWITYRDRLVHQNYVSRSPICPINTLMTHGFILTSHGAVSKNMSYDACLRELRCAFVCGSGMVELYNDYALMNSIAGGKLWADLAECIAWQKRNADVLPDAHWVGGNPWNGSASEVYGWASWNGTKATLALRNGANNAQSYSFTLREALNIPKNVTGSVILRKSFGVQDALEGLTLGEPLNIDATLTVNLPGSSVFCFDGINAEASIVNVTGIELTAENEKAEVTVGKTLVVKAAVNADATFPALEWETSDEAVATVTGGLVQGVKEGTATITAKATDGSGTMKSIEVTVTPAEPVVKEDYALNFDKNTVASRSDRYIKDITFKAGEADVQTVSVNEAKPYVDKTETTELVCQTGDNIEVNINKEGSWMHGYVFIDVDGDKQFSFNEGSTDQTGTEVMSFSFYSGDFDNDASGVNSAGTTITGNDRNTMVTPAFTAPATAGTYRIRFKMDWNSVDPGGQIGAGGTCSGANGILANGGMIVDAMLKVVKQTGIEGGMIDNNRENVMFDLSGRRLNKAPQHGVYILNNRKVVK